MYLKKASRHGFKIENQFINKKKKIAYQSFFFPKYDKSVSLCTLVAIFLFPKI